MPSALSPFAMLPALPLRAPQPLAQHPPPQRFGIQLQAILLQQMLGRQGRSEACLHLAGVFLANQLEYLLAKPARFGPIRSACRVTVLEPIRPSFPVLRPDPLGLPIAELQHLRRISYF